MTTDELAADLMEELAALEHIRWSEWQEYLHSRCFYSDEGMVIPHELFAQWRRQYSTAYADLSEREKEADRNEVRRYMQVIRRYA